MLILLRRSCRLSARHRTRTVPGLVRQPSEPPPVPQQFTLPAVASSSAATRPPSIPQFPPTPVPGLRTCTAGSCSMDVDTRGFLPAAPHARIVFGATPSIFAALWTFTNFSRTFIVVWLQRRECPPTMQTLPIPAGGDNHQLRRPLLACAQPASDAVANVN